jgi:hypothetical protein
MKKITLILVLLLTFALISAAVAQEEETTDDDSDDEDLSEEENEEETDEVEETELTEEDISESTMEEVSSMNTKPGAEVRLLQLEKSITRNILAGQEVIDRIAEKGNDTSELEAIITELEALKLEVQSLDPNSENAVEEFVNIKQEAIELVKEFREKAKELIEEGYRLALGQRIRNMNMTEIKEYNLRIRARIHSLNAEIVSKTFIALGIDNPELIDKVKSGEATFAEVKDEVKTTLQAMTPEERKAAWSNLKESGVKKDVAARARIEKARLKINERKANRMEWMTKAANRIQDADKRARVQATLEKRTQLVDNRIARIENRLDKAQAIRQNLKDKVAGGGQE